MVYSIGICDLECGLDFSFLLIELHFPRTLILENQKKKKKKKKRKVEKHQMMFWTRIYTFYAACHQHKSCAQVSDNFICNGLKFSFYFYFFRSPHFEILESEM